MATHDNESSKVSIFAAVTLEDAGVLSKSSSFFAANCSTVPWNDWDETSAAWVTRVWNPAQYIAAHQILHILFYAVPGLTTCNYIPDIMHCKCLGSDAVFLGSILRYMTHHFMPGTPDVNLREILSGLKAAYTELQTDTRYNTITHNMIHPPGSKLPHLKGRAAEISRLIPALIIVAKQYIGPDSPVHRAMLTGLELTAEIDKVIRDHKFEPKLKPDIAAHLKATCFGFCREQEFLIRAFRPNFALFNQTMKTHYLCHIGLMSSFVNPSLGSCWGGEDLMQVARRLVKSSQLGNQPDTGQFAAMRRYAQALGCEFILAEQMAREDVA